MVVNHYSDVEVKKRSYSMSIIESIIVGTEISAF